MKFLSFLLAAVLMLSCSKDGNSDAATAASSTGKGGSLARFTIVGNHLYLVDDYALNVYNISTPQQALFSRTINLRNGIETIFPYKDKLFIGSTDGMFIYSIADPQSPVLLGEAHHTRSCDPVVANDSIAFVTLRGNQPCGPAQDGLYTYDIKNLLMPKLIDTRLIPTPAGLGLQDQYLYVCQKNNGLSIYNVSNPAVPVLEKKITNRVFEDVICYENMLICYVSSGIATYDITDRKNPVMLSEINY
ncbi:MAG: hypothetical protein EOO88_40425 [Pedobacter sp.]|nr:MAG: hypothetical protein EOO88_40425 [Pedobacter sp.]